MSASREFQVDGAATVNYKNKEMRSISCCCKQVGVHLAASSDLKLSESANIIYKQIHKTQLVVESDDYIKTARVQCNAVSFLSKFLVQLQIAATKLNYTLVSNFVIYAFASVDWLEV